MAGVPFIFGNATTSIPLSNLDADFNTGLTIGNTTVGLGNTVTTLGNVTLTNTTISSTAVKIPSASMPVGSILQVVNASISTQVGNSTSTQADTGLTATITPKFSTSNILVIVDQNGCYNNITSGSNQGLGIYLLKNGSNIANIGIRAAGDSLAAAGALSIGSVSTNYLDSPATTSAITYKTQFSSLSNSPSVLVQAYSSLSTITLMEIAA